MLGYNRGKWEQEQAAPLVLLEPAAHVPAMAWSESCVPRVIRVPLLMPSIHAHRHCRSLALDPQACSAAASGTDVLVPHCWLTGRPPWQEVTSLTGMAIAAAAAEARLEAATGRAAVRPIFAFVHQCMSR